MNRFMKKEFVPGKLKPEYALMNKIIHDRIGPKGNEKSPIREQILFLYEVMTGKLIDYALVIWCVMRDFFKFSHESRHTPFPSLVTCIVEAVGMRGAVREKKVLPRLGPITNKTEAKSRAASTRPQPSEPSMPPPGITSAIAPAPLSTSPLKRMERRIKGGSSAFWESRSSLIDVFRGLRVTFFKESLQWRTPLPQTWRESQRN